MTTPDKDLLSATEGDPDAPDDRSQAAPAAPVPTDTPESRAAAGPGQQLEAGEG